METRRRVSKMLALGIACASCPLVLAGPVRAQSNKVWRIGFLDFASRKSSNDTGRYAMFVRGLRELGYVEGKNFTIEARFADGVAERLAGAAFELARSVDIIVTVSTPATRAAQKATRSVPIVIAVAGDPVGDGFAKTYARPGGNVTGLSAGLAEALEKQLEWLAAAVPGLARLGVLVNPANPAHTANLSSVRSLTRGILVHAVEGRSLAHIESAFAAMVRERDQAVIILGDAVFLQQVRQIAQLSLKHRLPSIYLTKEYPEAGGLMAYGPDLTENFRRAASFVDKIIKGAKPADLPIEQPTNFELVVNRKAAAALGIDLPRSILVRADRIID